MTVEAGTSSPNGPDGARAASGISARLWGLGRAWMEVTAQTASQEMQREAGRLTAAVVMLVVGALMLGMALLLVHVAGILWLGLWTGWPWWQVVLVGASPDVVVGLVLVLVGRSRLGGPVMPQTRALVGKTARVLTG